MSLNQLNKAPLIQSAFASSGTRSIGSSYKAVPLHSRTYRIGAGRILSDGNQSKGNQIGKSQLDVEAILSNNASGALKNTDNITNQSVPLKDQPTPLIFTDFSKEARTKILDVILSSKMESQVDRLLLRKMVELIEKDPAGARLLNASVESIKKEMTSSNETLDALSTFYKAYLSCNSSFTMQSMSANTALIFENSISSLKVGNTLNLLRENYNPNDFISIVSNLTSYDHTKLRDRGLHFAFWLGLRDACDSVKFGLSPGFFIEQNNREKNSNSINITSGINEIKENYVGIESLDKIGLSNFNIDTLNDPKNYSFNRIPYTAGLSSIQKILYYCGLISSELTVSVGMGITDSTPEGQKFGSLNDPISVALGVPLEGPDYLGIPNSIFSTTRIDSAGRFANSNSEASYLYEINNKQISAKSKYIDTILTDPLKNQAYVYETALNNTDILFQEVENFLKIVLQNGNSKKSLTTKSGLYSRIISDFGLMLENLGTGNPSLKTLVQFATMKKLVGNTADNSHKKELKLINQKILASKLRASLPENYQDDLVVKNKTITINHINNSNINSNSSDFDSAKNAIKNYIVEENNLTFSFSKLIQIKDLESKMIESNFENSSNTSIDIYNIVVQIVKDIEDECSGIINQFKPQSSFLRTNGTTKYSGFDSITIANMVYECFAILTNAFTDVKIFKNDRIYKIGLNDQSNNQVVGRLEKSGRFLNTLAAAISNKNTDFLINKSTNVITTDNVTPASETLNTGEVQTITPNYLVETANRILSEDDVFWNLYSVSKSVFINIKNASTRMIRYGNLMNRNATSGLGKIEKIEQQLIDFVNDSSLNSVDFLSSMNIVSLNRAKLRLRELESLQKPYDLAELPDQIYDVCKLFIESKNSYTKGKITAFGLAKDQFSDEFDSNDNSKRTLQTKIVRKSDFEPEVQYEDFQAPRLLLRYIATEEEVTKAITNLSANDDYSYSLESLALETKYYDMKTGDYVNLTALADALPIMESYLACKLLEICFDVSLEPHVFNSNGMEWNSQALRSIINIASSILQVEGLFDYMFMDNQDGTFSLRDAEQVNSKLRQETIRYDNEGIEYYENIRIDSAVMSLVHSLLDTLYFKVGLIKKMVFARDVFDGIYAVSFDQESMPLSNGSKTKKLLADFVDTYYISGDVS